MFPHNRSHMSSSGSQQRTYETHRTVYHSYTSSQNRSTHHMSTSSASNQWHAETNNEGHLVIAKKSADQSKAADRRAERNIRRILEDAKSRRSSIEHTTNELMRVVHKYNRGHYTDSEHRPSTSHSSSSSGTHSSPKPKKPSPTAASKTPSTKSILKKTPKHTHTFEPKKVANRLASVSGSGNMQKIPRELMQLCNSDGFVSKPPIESKRTPRKVARYSELMYKDQTQSTRRMLTGAKQKGDKTKIVHIKPISSTWKIPKASPSASQSHPTSFAVAIPSTSVQQVGRTTSAPASLLRAPYVKEPENASPTVSNVQSTIKPDATTVSVPGQAKGNGNFMHNRIKITHYPMIEVKIEKEYF